MTRTRALAAAAVGLVLLPLLLPTAAGAAAARPSAPAVSTARTYVDTCNEQGNFCQELWDLPYNMLYVRDSEGRFDFTNTRDWLDSLSRARIVAEYGSVDIQLLYKYEIACELLDVAIPDIPVVGAALEWIAGSACSLLRPFVVAVDWSLNLIANIVNPIRLFIGDVSEWVLARSVALFGRVIVSVFEGSLNLTVDALDLVGGLPAQIGSVFVYGEDMEDLGEQVLAAGVNVNNFGSNIGDVVSQLSFYDASESLCWSSPWGPVCPLWMFTGSTPPGGFGALVVLWIGFWAAFVVVQIISWFARVTDS